MAGNYTFQRDGIEIKDVVTWRFSAENTGDGSGLTRRSSHTTEEWVDEDRCSTSDTKKVCKIN